MLVRLGSALARVEPGIDQGGVSGAVKCSRRGLIGCLIQAMQFRELSCFGGRLAGASNDPSIVIKGRDSSSAQALVRYDELEWYLSIV